MVDKARRPRNVADLKLRMNAMLTVQFCGCNVRRFGGARRTGTEHRLHTATPSRTSPATLQPPSTMTTPVSVVGVYRKFPKELFRINKGPQIRLREYKLRHGNSFDVLANASGNIEPKALDPSTYAGKYDITCSYYFVCSSAWAQLPTGRPCGPTVTRCALSPDSSRLLGSSCIPFREVCLSLC